MPTALACPACRTGLLARRGDPLCLTCMKASREMPSRPLWLFDSPLLRQALAQVDLPAVPAIVRAACGLSQRDLAAIVGWSPAALSYYERGVRDGMFDIRTALQFADAVGMPRAALLPLVCADPDASLAADAEDGTGVELSWRDFGGLAVAAGVAAAMPPVSVPRGVTSSHVRYWQSCTDMLYARDRSSQERNIPQLSGQGDSDAPNVHRQRPQLQPTGSPTVYRTDRETWVVQGWMVTEPDALAQMNIPDGETVVEIPDRMIQFFRQEGRDTGNG